MTCADFSRVTLRETPAPNDDFDIFADFDPYKMEADSERLPDYLTHLDDLNFVDAPAEPTQAEPNTLSLDHATMDDSPPLLDLMLSKTS